MSSLRTRLWLSYAFLTGILLLLALVIFMVALRPLFYRQTILRLEMIYASVSGRSAALQANAPDRVDSYLRREADSRQVRFMLIDSNRRVLVDSATELAAGLATAPFKVPLEENPLRGDNVFRENGQAWLYTIHRLEGNFFLTVAVPRPRLPLKTILTDELVTRMARIYGAAVLAAFLLSLWLANWFTRPLKQLAAGAQQVAAGQFPTLAVDGPDETRELTAAFNEMSLRVQAAQNSQRDFVANVSHEMKTPLTSIQGFSQAIMDGTVDTPAALQQAAGVIHNEATRLHRLVMDLLILSRLESGTANLQFGRVNLAVLLASVVEKMSPQARQADVSLTCDCSVQAVVNGDGDRLSQVFTNLLDNALKFSHSGGRVFARLEVQGERAVVLIQDSGIGIDPQDQARIFERFYQVERSRKGGARRGVGLGLPIAREIVVAHGGEISVDSVRGQGSTFMVKLPLVSLLGESE